MFLKSYKIKLIAYNIFSTLTRLYLEKKWPMCKYRCMKNHSQNEEYSNKKSMETVRISDKERNEGKCRRLSTRIILRKLWGKIRSLIINAYENTFICTTNIALNFNSFMCSFVVKARKFLC